MVLQTLLRKRMVVPDYDVLEQLGEGGMGVVCKGRHQATGRAVAIKFIAADLVDNFEVAQRFEQEYRIASKLDHPNIVQVLGFGRMPDVMYLIMEYVAGPSLGQHLESHGPLPEAEAIALITQLAQALDFAHQRWMIHRDVKPDNILLPENGPAKLTDFGLVKDLIGDRHLTQPLSTLGTTHFMAPEQSYDAKRVDHRCDIYSLGATLYMALTGKKPFANSRSIADMMQQMMQGNCTPARHLVPQLSEEVDATIRRAMNPDPAQRPASCAEFVQSLKRGGKVETSPAAVPRENEQRASVRVRHEAGTSCMVRTSLHAESVEGNERWPGFMQDISRGGFALILGRRLEAGSVVTVDLPLLDGRATTTLEGSVVRVQPSSYGHWRIGCAFAQSLDSEDWRALL